MNMTRWKFLGIGIVAITAVTMICTMAGCSTEAEDFPDFTVTFVANNGTNEPDKVTTIKGDSKLGIYLPAGGSVLFENPNRPAVEIYSAPTGRRLGKWNTQANGFGASFYGNNRVTKDLTLYAQWEGTYNYNHYWTRQLQYNSYGSTDSEGIYEYRLGVPIAELQSHPTTTDYTNVKGQIKAGKTIAVALGYFSPDSGTGPELRLNRTVQSLTFQLWDGIANKALSNVIEKTNVIQGNQLVFDAADVFTTTADATDGSLEANQLLISATNNLLVDKITVFGTVSLTPEAGAIVETGNADVVQNFEGFAHNSGTYTGLYASGEAIAGVVQTDDFAYVRTNNSSAKALLVGHLTASTTTSGSLPKITVTLPVGKTLADYSGISIKYMGLSGNSAAKTNVIMVGSGLTADNFSNAVATAANAATKKTIAAGNGVTQSGASYSSYPYFTWNIRPVTFATTGGVPTVISEAGNSFEMAFGAYANATGVIYLVDDIVLTGKEGTVDYVVADFENSPTISKIGDGVIYSIVDLNTLATYTGKYGKVLFVLSNTAGAIPGLSYTAPAKETPTAYNKLSFTYFALNEGANNKTLAVKTGADANAAIAAAGVTVESGNASTYKTLSVPLTGVSSGGTFFMGIGPANGSAGAIYLVDDITLYY
jgi:hypothetical protein